MQNRKRWKFDKRFTGAAETEKVARKNSAASDQVSLKCEAARINGFPIRH